jgi:putative transposase
MNMDDLQIFIHTSRDAREVKRALAVQNTLQGRSRPEVAAELGYSVSWVDKWRWHYAQFGVAGLRIGYKGSQGYLTVEQKTEIQAWLEAQSTWSVRALAAHIEAEYAVRYKSVRSYHALLNQARMSWKKSQATPPKPDPDKVAATRETIKKNGSGSLRPGQQTQCAVDGG